MVKKSASDATDRMERDLKAAQKARFLLRLYIAGNSARSNRAILAVREVCETHLKGRYQLEVVDIYQQPRLAEGEQIIATPTLIKHLPLPLRRVIGDMSDADRLLFGLDLRRTKPAKDGHRARPAAKNGN